MEKITFSTRVTTKKASAWLTEAREQISTLGIEEKAFWMIRGTYMDAIRYVEKNMGASESKRDFCKRIMVCLSDILSDYEAHCAKVEQLSREVDQYLKDHFVG